MLFTRNLAVFRNIKLCVCDAIFTCITRHLTVDVYVLFYLWYFIHFFISKRLMRHFIVFHDTENGRRLFLSSSFDSKTKLCDRLWQNEPSWSISKWIFWSVCNGAWSTHTKSSHTRVNSPHFWSTHPIYEIKKDYSEGKLMVFSTYCGTINLSYMLCSGICLIWLYIKTIKAYFNYKLSMIFDWILCFILSFYFVYDWEFNIILNNSN